jgi:hypothetical protein
LVFNNTNVSLIGDATGLRGATTVGSLFCSLHTADPGETGTQSTSEAAYTSYARVAVSRSGAGWTVASGSASNAAAINWPACTGGTSSVTHWAIGTDASGTGKLLYKGALTTSPLSVSTGITPTAAIGAIVVTED